jgi:hypothetical protein
LPFLRFTRDKRGYESTFLMHMIRRRGKARPRILYWFRTPPDVKVGRGALDEDAIRSIEEHNPDVTFDWAKILEVQPPPAPVPEDVKTRGGRRAKGDRRGAGGAQPSGPQPPAIARGETRRPGRGEPATQTPPAVRDDTAVQAVGEIEGPPEAVEPEPAADQVRSPLEAAVGREQVARLRARFAELQARITERGGDAARVEALRLQAESLNPDTWVTAEEARAGLAASDARVEEFRRLLGLRKRRRSRRGGVRRRRRGGAVQEPSAGLHGEPSSGAAAREDATTVDRPADPSGPAEPDEGGDPD